MPKILFALLLPFAALASGPWMIPDLSGSPRIAVDGQLDEAVWQQAASLQGMSVLGRGGRAECDARIRAFYADGRLYLALEAEEPSPEQLRMTVKPGNPSDHPKAFTNDDLLELFLVQGERYACQLAFNPAGTLIFYGSRPTRLLYRDWRQPRLKEEWRLNCEYKVAVLADRWQVEMALDAADFGGFAEGGWRFNLARERRAGTPGNSTLAPIAGDSFLQREYYLPFAVAGVTGAEVRAAAMLAPTRPAEWIVENTVLKKLDGALAFSGNGRLQSQDALNVDGGAGWLSGEFRVVGPAREIKFFFGLAMLDANGGAILPQHVLFVPGSETTLAADLTPGAREIRLAEASKWQEGGNYFIAFDAEPDATDLPNRNLSYAAGVSAIARQSDGSWTLRVADGTRVTRPAGSRVREHFTGTSFWYAGGGAQTATAEWRQITATVQDYSVPGTVDASRYWPGAAKVRLLIWVLDGDPATALEFRNLRFNR